MFVGMNGIAIHYSRIIFTYTIVANEVDMMGEYMIQVYLISIYFTVLLLVVIIQEYVVIINFSRLMMIKSIGSCTLSVAQFSFSKVWYPKPALLAIYH